MISESKIAEVVDKIAKGFNPEKIILFGSYATGNANDDSDLDLIIIQENELPWHKRGIDIRLMLRDSKIPMDLLHFTNDEFEIEKNKRFSFLSGALKTSKLLYERKN